MLECKQKQDEIYRTCINGNRIYTKAETCSNRKTCGCFKVLINDRRDKVGHALAVKESFKKSRKHVDFSKCIKESYNNTEKILKTLDTYTLEETVDLLKSTDFYYKKYIGKTKHRTCIKDNPKLYKSIKEHCKSLSIGQHKLPFSGMLNFLIEHNGDYDAICCDKCNSALPFAFNTFYQYGLKLCSKHRPAPNSREFFKIKFKDKWGEQFKIYHDKIAKKGNLGLSGFIARHGELGKEKYKEYWNQIFEERQKCSYSKISQILFWMIYEQLDENYKRDCHFAELNKEYTFFLTEEDRKLTDKMCFYLDFKCRNKIIEYNGDYWHKNALELDFIRSKILKNNSLDIIFIQEEEFNRNNYNSETVQKCIDFIRG